MSRNNSCEFTIFVADQFDSHIGRVVGGLDLFRESEPGVSIPDWTKTGVYSSVSFLSINRLEVMREIFYSDC